MLRHFILGACRRAKLTVRSAYPCGCRKLVAHAQQKGHRAGWAECAECGRCTVRLLQGVAAAPVPASPAATKGHQQIMRLSSGAASLALPAANSPSSVSRDHQRRFRRKLAVTASAAAGAVPAVPVRGSKRPAEGAHQLAAKRMRRGKRRLAAGAGA